MEVTQTLHMNKGVGEVSYAMNCTVQSNIISRTRPLVEEAILKILSAEKVPESLGIADLGCASGPNSLSAISEIIDAVYGRCRDLGRPPPELRVSLNDLPSNDFNSIFSSLLEFYRKVRAGRKCKEVGHCFISAVPGSFYGRLFPSRSLHLVHSSSSLHWLSQVNSSLCCCYSSLVEIRSNFTSFYVSMQTPVGLGNKDFPRVNKGKVYISKDSPKEVSEAYSEQFKKDMRLFLESRSEEVVAGGRMLLSLMERRSSDPTSDSAVLWDLLSQALMIIVNEGMIEQDKVDSFNAPYYAPSTDELALEIRREGSFLVDRMETFLCRWDWGNHVGMTSDGVSRAAEQVGRMVRAVVEPILEAHLGAHIMDRLFMKYEDLVKYRYLKGEESTENLCIVVSLIRKKETTE
ncbi:hypothetical protein SAY86_028193 [Trapa natans]|uniref:Jasmonate O-methyltransferase n=1 Tax=Trapa natans TaxID=22666 RepID=A0AAN7M0M5_TRANT|nr:hypothetical protein SAY86_028193 [Trapa natans]